MRTSELPETYLTQLTSELACLETDLIHALADSKIRNIDPNRHDGGIIFVGAQKWGWVASDAALTTQRMDLLARLRDLEPRIRLLFQHQIPEVAKRLDVAFNQLEKWLDRVGRTIPCRPPSRRRR